MTDRASSFLAGLALCGALAALWLPERLSPHQTAAAARDAPAASASGVWYDRGNICIRPNGTVCAESEAMMRADYLCRPGYARSRRLLPEQYYPIAEEAYRRAGVPWSQRQSHRLDHIVPLCLGGTWDQANLQVQAVAEAAEKDRLEVATCKTYCAGEIDLETARLRFVRTKP